MYKTNDTNIVTIKPDQRVNYLDLYQALLDEGFQRLGKFYVDTIDNIRTVYKKDEKDYVVDDYECYNTLIYYIDLKEVSPLIYDNVVA